MNELEILFRSAKDFFTKPMLKIAFIPLVVIMFILYIIFFTAADFGLDALVKMTEESSHNKEISIDSSAPFYFNWVTHIMVFLLKYPITSWLVGFLLYTMGAIFILMLSMFLTLIIIGFLTPMILKILHKKHYSSLQINGNQSLVAPIVMLIKSFIIMILLFILLIPLYFIPLLNIIAFNFPLYYFFHKLLNFDVSSSLLNKQEYKIIYDENSFGFRGKTIFLYIISMIPFTSMFLAIFYIIYLGNTYFIKLEKLRENANDNLDTNLKQKRINKCT